MKIIKGIKIGGLQQKIFNLMLFFLIALIGAFLELFMEVVFSPIGYSVTRRWRRLDVGGAYLAAHAA